MDNDLNFTEINLLESVRLIVSDMRLNVGRIL